MLWFLKEIFPEWFCDCDATGPSKPECEECWPGGRQKMKISITKELLEDKEASPAGMDLEGVDLTDVKK